MTSLKYLDPADGQWKYIDVPPHTHPGQTRIVGEVIAYAGAVPPAGWLICDGREILAADYPLLAAVLGTWGPNGAAFLPDLRARSIVGTGGAVATNLGDRAGAGTHGHAGNALPTHDHGNTASAAAHTHGTVARTTSTVAGHAHSNNPPTATSSSAGGHSHTTNNNDGSISVAFGTGSKPASTIHEHSVSSNGSHTHTTNVPNFDSGSAGSHSHSLAELATGTTAGGGHAHDTTAVSGGTPSVQSSSSYHPVLGLNYIIYTGT